MNDQLLAIEYLNEEIQKIKDDIASERRSLQFNSTYQPSGQILSPRGEPGSLDYSDYKAALLEEQQWYDYEQDEAIESGQETLEVLHGQLAELKAELEFVKNNEPSLIEQYAPIQKEKLKLQEKKKRYHEERNGRKFIGLEAVFEKLQQIWGIVNKAQNIKGTVGSLGWEFSRKYTKPLQFQFYFKNNIGCLNGYDGFISIVQREDGYAFCFEDLRGVKIDPNEKNKWKQAKKDGIGYRFCINKEKIFNQGHIRLHPHRQWGYFEVENIGTNEPFTRESFDICAQIIEDLLLDLKVIVNNLQTK